MSLNSRVQTSSQRINRSLPMRLWRSMSDVHPK